MPVINPDHLLDQADRLVMPPTAGAPRQTDLRRAISTAYYALFHTILISAADEFAGQANRQTSRYEIIYRGINHKKIRDLSDDIIKQNLPTKYVKYEPQGGFGVDLIATATAFVELQEKRHLADYDPLFGVKIVDAALAVASARAAVAHFRNAPRPRRKAFLTLVVFTPR